MSDCLAAAERIHPALAAAAAEAESADAVGPQVRSLPDPRLGYGYWLPDFQGRIPMRRQTVSVSQEFPWPYKRRLEGEMAQHGRDAARAAHAATLLRIRADVASAYAETWYLRRAAAIQSETLDLMAGFERLVRTKYAVSQAGQADVTRAQVELSKMENELASLRDMHQGQAARLNAAIGLPVGAPLVEAVELPEGSETIPSEADVAARAEQEHPELKALAADVAREEAAVAVARSRYVPDPMFEMEYMDMRTRGMSGSDGEADELLARVSINLPIWSDKLRAAVRAAQARRRAAAKMLDDRRNMLAADARMALVGLRDARRRMSLYKDTLIPQGRQALAATQTAYATGGADLLDVLESVRVLLEFQLQYERARADCVRQQAQLELAAGVIPSQDAPAHGAAVP